MIFSYSLNTSEPLKNLQKYLLIQNYIYKLLISIKIFKNISNFLNKHQTYFEKKISLKFKLTKINFFMLTLFISTLFFINKFILTRNFILFCKS